MNLYSDKFDFEKFYNETKDDDMYSIVFNLIEDIQCLKEERGQLKELLNNIEKVIDGDPNNIHAFSEKKLAEHDAEVIEKLRDYLSGVYCGDYEYVIDEYINQLRQKVQEEG